MRALRILSLVGLALVSGPAASAEEQEIDCPVDKAVYARDGQRFVVRRYGIFRAPGKIRYDVQEGVFQGRRVYNVLAVGPSGTGWAESDFAKRGDFYSTRIRIRWLTRTDQVNMKASDMVPNNPTMSGPLKGLGWTLIECRP